MKEHVIPNDTPIFPIRTAAKLLNISVHTLRMYEREGLIIPYKSPGNQRLFSNTDIARITRFRKDMKENKISINGLRALTSLVPCWQIKKCSTQDRDNCKAFRMFLNPCWVYKHTGNTCETNNCRECDVYRQNSDFESIRKTIRSIS